MNFQSENTYTQMVTKIDSNFNEHLIKMSQMMSVNHSWYQKQCQFHKRMLETYHRPFDAEQVEYHQNSMEEIEHNLRHYKMYDC